MEDELVMPFGDESNHSLAGADGNTGGESRP